MPPDPLFSKTGFTTHRNIIVAICIVVFAFVLIIFWSSSQNKSKSVDLVNDLGWARFVGVATSTPEGLHVIPLDNNITHQDGSAPQPNPPINLFGPRLAVKGDFIMTATMKDIDEWGALRLYGEVPIVYDQWRFERGSINIEVATKTITVKIWDGSFSTSNDMRQYDVPLKNETKISLEHKNNEFIIGANGKILGSMPDHSIFEKGEIWFGTDAAPESNGWILSGLSVNSSGMGSVRTVETPTFKEDHNDPRALRNLAKNHPRKIDIGTAISLGPVLVNEEFRKIAVGEFSMWTPENSMKPQFIHPRPEVYAFRNVDILVDLAKENEIAVHGHSLVYHKSNPVWMNESAKEDRERIMVDHIKTIVGHFKGRVKQWDVVNEPLASGHKPYWDNRRGLESTLWYEAMGEKYIDIAFRTAHEADPDAKLYLNDYGLERDGERWYALLGLVSRLKQRGVPIHGVGFESHVYGDGDYSDPVVLKRHMNELAAMGLKVRISEIDVTGDDPKAQIDQYLIALDVCLKSANCTGYSTWGISDMYGSTTRSDRYPQVFGTSLLWDWEMKPKPALEVLKARLTLP